MIVRYVERDGLGFLVRKDWGPWYATRNCLGSGAMPVRPVKAGTLLACPVCGRVCSTSPKGRVWAHHVTQREE
jgi:hypothetical protein